MKKSKFLSILFLSFVLIAINISCSKDDTAAPAGGGGTGGSTSKAVTISDYAFTANALTIAKGISVTWTNYGAVAHTVTSDDATSFDSGNIAPGGTYTHVFNTSGTFAYHCELHSSMTATITVSP